MGKTKIKTIDDSATEEVKKTSKVKKEVKAKTKGGEDIVASADQSLSEPGEVSTESTSLDVHEADAADSDDSQKASLTGENDNVEPTKHAKYEKPAKAKPRSKKYKQSLLFFDKKSQDIDEPDRGKLYSIPEAVEMAKKLSYSKFKGSLEAHIVTTPGVRGLVSLPYLTGKKLTILVFGKEASTSGADIVGTDEIIEEISKGKVDFDLIITTAEWMPKLAKAAKILGPRGLMPNPKNGTITDDLKKAVESFQAGKTEYKTEPKAPVIHLRMGELTQSDEELSTNIKTLLQTIGKSRVKRVHLSPTMGPSVKVDLASL